MSKKTSPYMKNRALAIIHKFFPDVVEVKDATKGLDLKVTKQDAKSKGKKDPAHCALAQACNRQLKLDGAIISLSRAYLIKGTTATRYEVPQTIGREITSFDRGAAFLPGSYRLKKISVNHKIGTARGSKYGPKNKKRPRPYHFTEGVRAVGRQ